MKNSASLRLFGKILLIVMIGKQCCFAEAYRPYRIAGHAAMTLDGKLDEPEWIHAPVEGDFMQYDPIAGAAPTERTEFRILYNNEYLWIGMRAYDSEPQKLIAKHLERDFPNGEDDGTAVVIDTYNDKSTGLVFITNLLNSRYDEEFTGNGSFENVDYNTYWDVNSHVDSLGYTTEYRIPFSTLRFESKDTVVMGLRMGRLIKRKDEFLIYPPCDPKVDNAYFNVSLAREMEFFDLKGKQPFYVSPYVSMGYSEENALNEAGDGYVNNSEFLPGKGYVDNESLDKALSNIGVDVKYGLSKNFTLDLTVNTDFAQAEVDDVVINLTKFDVNLPEKRSFFLESKNYLGFSTTAGNEMFNTRSIGRENDQIVPIIGGARVTGKSNGWQIGTLDMQSKAIPEAEIAAHNFFVFRTRKDIDSLGSFVGGIVTNRVDIDSSRNHQTIGLDVVKRLNEHVTVVGNVEGTAVKANFSGGWKQMNIGCGIFRSAKEGIFYGLWNDVIGSKFAPVMGYVEEADVGIIGSRLGHSWQAKESSSLAYWSLETNAKFKWKLDSRMEELKLGNLQAGFIFKNALEIQVIPLEASTDVLFEDWQIAEDITIPQGKYKMNTAALAVSLPARQYYTGGIESSIGSFYGGDIFSIAPELTINFSKHFIAEIEYEYDRIRFPDNFSATGNGLFKSDLLRLKLYYYFSSTLSVNLFTQYDSRSSLVGSNFRLRYNPREGTDLYIVFNQGLNTERASVEPKPPFVTRQAFTVKFVKTFGF